MKIYIIYFLIVLFSNTIGAISGMGGGVIIKPVLDSFGYHPLVGIAFYSCVAVFTMSISSTYKQLKNGVTISWKEAISISIGSVVGGVLGNNLFNRLLTVFGSEEKVQLIQIVLTVISLVLVLIYTIKVTKTLHLKNILAYFLVGLFLGGLSTLLGIGGGPINVSLLIFCFGLSMKNATVYSIITIFFSQLSKLVEIALTTGFKTYDLSILWVIIPAALLGGYVGGILSGKMSDKHVSQIYIIVCVVVIGINLMNGLGLIL